MAYLIKEHSFDYLLSCPNQLLVDWYRLGLIHRNCLILYLYSLQLLWRSNFIVLLFDFSSEASPSSSAITSEVARFIITSHFSFVSLLNLHF